MSDNSIPNRMLHRRRSARPGPVTRNAFLNFLRDFRGVTSKHSMPSVTRAGALKWRALSDSAKLKYFQMALTARSRRPKKTRKQESINRKGKNKGKGRRRRRRRRNDDD